MSGSDGGRVVDRGGRDDQPVPQTEDGEGRVVVGASEDGLRGCLHVPDGLDVESVPVRPEPGRGRRRFRGAEEGRRCPGTVVLGCFPVLGAGHLAHSGRVADGEHRRIRGDVTLVDEDAAVHLQPGRPRQLGARHHADAEHHRVVEPRDSAEPDLDALGPVDEGLHGGLYGCDPVAGVQCVQPGSQLRAERGGQRHGDRVDEDDLATETYGGGGDLGTDQSGADDQHSGTGSESRAQPVGVVRRTQDMHALATDPQNREAGGGTARREHDTVGAQQVSVAELDGAVPRPQRGHRRPVDQPYPLVVVPPGRLEGDLLDVLRAGQEVLRQRRTVVGEVPRIDEGDITVEAARSQRGGGAHAGDAAAHDDDTLGHGDSPGKR